MEEFSDTTNRNIIILFFLFYYLYIRYRQTQLKKTRGFNKIKCNPFQMMVGGMINEEEASKSFQYCMEYSTSEKTRMAIDDAKKKYEKNVDNIVNDISNNVSDGNDKTKKQQEKLFEFVNQKTNSVNDLVTQQQKINKVIKKTSGPIKDVMINLQNITTQLKDVFANFQSKIN